MGDGLDDRRRGLEEEYFHHKNKEAVAKMREKMRIAAEAKAAGASSLQCPRCDGSLKPKTFDEVEIDMCGTCGGIWLDAGELEKLTKKDGGGWLAGLWNSLHDDD